MKNIPIVVSVFALVLVGMLFGLNFQVSESAVTFFNAMGTTLSGIGAAAAAYISYLSIGQWKEQSKHSLLYEYLSTIETSLKIYEKEFIEKAITQDGLPVTKALRAFGEPESIIRNDYLDAYQKASEIADGEKLEKLESLELYKLKSRLFYPFDRYNTAACRSKRFIDNAPEELLNEKSLDEVPELHECSVAMFRNVLEIREVFDDAIKTVRDIRASL